MDTGDLADAVREHRVVELRYRGRGGVQARVVQPHAVYRSATEFESDPDYNRDAAKYRHGLVASA